MARKANPPPFQAPALPPASNPTAVPVLSPKPGLPVDVLVLSNELTTVWVHWIEGRTVPCVEEPCPHQVEAGPRRWKAYLACWEPRWRRRVVVELSATAARSLLGKAASLPPLRGRRLQLARTGQKANSSVSASCEPWQGSVGIPPDFPVWPVLAMMWGLLDSE